MMAGESYEASTEVRLRGVARHLDVVRLRYGLVESRETEATGKVT